MMLPGEGVAMPTTRNFLATTVVSLIVVCAGASMTRASDCEDLIARHMVGEALLAAHFVAEAEKAGMKPGEINAMLKNIAGKSAIQEFWITDSSGHAYLTNTGVDFTFSPDPAKQPQASAFWPLISGDKQVVIQDARKREIDDRVFKYVGVAGIDRPRIVQIGVAAENLPTCK
jgi:adenylate cyclase